LARLFLDANVLFSAAHRANAGVARLWEIPDVSLLTSTYAVEEARRNLSEPEQLKRLTSLLEPMEIGEALMLPPSLREGIELAEEDWPILGGAKKAGATHLVTGDLKHFGRYLGRTLLGVEIQRPGYFLKRTP